MMNKYFKNINTLEELKKEYKRLALANHPDRGGDVEIMKAINAEYDIVFAKVKNTHVNAKGETYTKENTETPDIFKDIIDKLIKMAGLEIEIIGSFIWVGGNTKEHKDELKAVGFKWHSAKKLWYKSPEGYRRKTRKNMSMDEIRDAFGTSGTMYGESGAMLQGA